MTLVDIMCIAIFEKMDISGIEMNWDELAIVVCHEPSRICRGDLWDDPWDDSWDDWDVCVCVCQKVVSTSAAERRRI